MTQEFINNLADKLQKVGALHAIGETWISIDSTIPAGGVPFLGQLVSRSVWADLFAWATAQGKVKTESEWQSHASANGGNCPFYSDGDGSTTFRMPCIKSYLKGADTLTDAGSYKPEGLPNITGGDASTTVLSYGGAVGDVGAIQTVRRGTANLRSGDGVGDICHILFNASKSNAIYGNSSHVTPETHFILIGVYAVGVVANVGSADATQFLSGLATVESNLSTTVRIVEKWSDGANWYRKWSDGFIEQGGYCDRSSGKIAFHTPFTDASSISVNYTIYSTGNATAGSEAYTVKSVKTTYATCLANSTDYFRYVFWNAKGY